MPAHFAMDDAAVRDLLDHHGAADLVTVTSDGLVATLLPFVHDPTVGEHGVLLGHVARNNPQWRADVAGEALVIVRGPDAYVSPSWYASKAEHGRVVPTWNYVTAHVYGGWSARRPGVGRGAGAPADREARGLPRAPLVGGRRPARFLEGQLRAIVGVELLITRIEAKAKLSQNRPEADVAGVVAGLAADGHAEAARAVEHARRG